jgi:leader peptidase (prepilin peptidase)/N-methyltransferase
MSAALAGGAPLVAVLVALVAAIIDARTGFIPDRLTAPAAALALAFASLGGSLAPAALGALAGAAALGVPFAISRGRALGLGDVKLAATIGIGLGPVDVVRALGVAFAAGGAYATWLLVTRRAGRRAAVPFGPFLALGAATIALTGAVR